MPLRRSQKKRSAEPQQKQNHRRPVIDPLVNPGSSAHRHQARSKTDQARPHHRMVTLAQSSPGDRSARAHQSKTATVMLGFAGAAVWITIVLGLCVILFAVEGFVIPSYLEEWGEVLFGLALLAAPWTVGYES